MSFEARYGGKCASCGDWIKVGDLVIYSPWHTVVHEGCEDITPEHHAAEKVCPLCFVTACDCGLS